MNSSDQPVISAADMITKVFSNIDKSELQNSNKLFNVWNSVVSKAGNYGDRLAEHTHPVDLKNGVLLVEADHPGWIQTLQLYSKFVVTGLNRTLPDLKITSIAFRLAGSDASLCAGESYDEKMKKHRAEMTEKLDEQDKVISEHEQKSGIKAEPPEKKEELPPKLKDIFEDLRKSMLTNSSK